MEKKKIEVNKIYTFHEIDTMSKLKKISLNFYNAWNLNLIINQHTTFNYTGHVIKIYTKYNSKVSSKINTECKLLEYIREQTFEKPFIHVTLNINDEKKDIHEYLDKYYVDGNEILTFKFLKWYLKYYYNTQLTEPYTIDIG